MSNATDSHTRARLLAVSAEHSSDWLHALPLSACGLRMDDNTIRISVGLRLGAKLCEPHSCVCGADVDILGHHGLVCNKSAGRSSRHNYINDLIWRALGRAGVPSVKEPSGLTRDDGKRPDGLTQIPWEAGRCVTWDVTVTDTLAASNISHSALAAGAAAEKAAERKLQKYTELSACYTFIPLPLRPLDQLTVWARSLLGASGLELGALQEMCAKVASFGSDCRWLSSVLTPYVYKARLRP